MSIIATRQTVTNGGQSVRFIIILLLKGGDYIPQCACGSQTHRQTAAVIECLNRIAINSHQIKMYTREQQLTPETGEHRTGPFGVLEKQSLLS